MRLTLTLAALLVAGAAHAQDHGETWLERAAYSIFGPDRRGAVITESGNQQTDETIEARDLGFGQSLRRGWHSRDRSMRIALTSVDRDTGQRQSFVGAFVATIRDLGDQGRGSPAVITLRSGGEVVDRIRVRGGSTRRMNGNVRTVSFSGPLRDAELTIRAGRGKMRGRGPDLGAPGYGDGFSVKVRTADDCPPDEGPKMTHSVERKSRAGSKSRGGKNHGGKGKGRR